MSAVALICNQCLNRRMIIQIQKHTYLFTVIYSFFPDGDMSEDSNTGSSEGGLGESCLMGVGGDIAPLIGGEGAGGDQARLHLKRKLQRNRTSFTNDQIDQLEKGIKDSNFTFFVQRSLLSCKLANYNLVNHDTVVI